MSFFRNLLQKLGLAGGGATAGAATAAGATYMMTDAPQAEQLPTPIVPDQPEVPVIEATAETATGEIQMASSVDDKMSFAEAFAAARAEVGAGGTFSWHGQTYGTYYENEWNAMSPDQQAAFSHNAPAPAETAAPLVPEAAQTEAEPVVAAVEPEAETPVAATVENEAVEAEVVADAEPAEATAAEATIDLGEGTPVDINEDGAVDGMAYNPSGDGSAEVIMVDANQNEVVDAMVLDSDNDGAFDTVAIDSNEDGDVDETRSLSDESGGETAASDTDDDGLGEYASVDMSEVENNADMSDWM